MYLLEVTLNNLLKKEIKVERLEDALIFISEFERFSSNSVISVRTVNGVFAITKNSIYCVELNNA